MAARWRFLSTPVGARWDTDFDAAGNLIVVDTAKGLISIAPDKTITVLADTVDGEPPPRAT